LGTIKIEMPNWSVGIRKTHVPGFNVKKVLITSAKGCSRSRRLFEFADGSLLYLVGCVLRVAVLSLHRWNGDLGLQIADGISLWML
jgi:hypothetical protein